MNPWEWITTSIPAGAALSGVGVGAFVTAILTDRLFTRGQHLRRVADLNAHHERELLRLNEHHARELAEKDARMADLRESRDGYKEAAAIERERADTATATVGEIHTTLEAVLHVMQSLNLALPTPERSA
ncbi:hypothetical protein SEA_FUZZBUSTER_45 [Microbacterium phage FuzzBuster]|uniref:Uncharacterized protein n=1 Tax=Microbacterium phage FuzzBuster TaxID=2590935 RepID=A0A516KV14_9CAUD|nr:hypothetical protein SEA_FUZZBUSTER_45 [Microbacterium phage FuzzBuster]